MKIFIHASLRHLRNLPEASAIMEKLLRTAGSDPLIASPHILDEVREFCPEAVTVEAGQKPEADLAISLGGDGTFIRTAQCIGNGNTPILGINAGHLGYLADFTPRQFLDADISDLQLDRRMMLKVESTTLGGTAYALNEVALLKTDSASMIEVSASIGPNALTTYRADGLLVASPTGSTAYNISVGGPIVDPSLEAIILSPIAPHSLTMRPLVVSPQSAVHLKGTSRNGQLLLSIDGNSIPLPSGAEVTVSQAPHSLTVATRPGHHFADTLRAKLLWGQ